MSRKPSITLRPPLFILFLWHSNIMITAHFVLFQRSPVVIRYHGEQFWRGPGGNLQQHFAGRVIYQSWCCLMDVGGILNFSRQFLGNDDGTKRSTLKKTTFWGPADLNSCFENLLRRWKHFYFNAFVVD